MYYIRDTILNMAKIFDKLRLRRSEKKVASSLGGAASQLTVEQQTIIIGGWFSVCGNCKENADFHETSHIMEQMLGSLGCGVTYLYVATDRPGADFAHLRPDLTPVDLGMANDGITDEMEDRMIGGMQVIEVLEEER